MADAAPGTGRDHASNALILTYRFLAWCVVGTLFAFLLNVYLNQWQGWPGVPAVLGGERRALALLQAFLYALGLAVPAAWVLLARGESLRADAERIGTIATYVVKAAFWAVVLVGIADAVISFLRVEGLLGAVFGSELAQDLGRSRFRGPYVHMPLVAAGLVVAALTRGIGVTWLALLVVVAELVIVITRFIYSYEQAFMGDLVRMWYASLFLFASAYTLVEEGHVRVDVFYSGFSARTKGLVNAVGSVVLGLPFCAVVLFLGMAERTGIITAPILAFEVTQQGFGMYIKYLMAGFLAVFAGSMLIQFAAYFLEGIADYRGDPGHRDHEPTAPA